MNSSESAEQIVRMTLQGMEVALKVTGSGTERVIAGLYTLIKDKKQTKGKATLNTMLKTGSQLDVFGLKEQDIKKFTEESKRYGVLFTALINKNKPSPDGLVDIMVRREDAPKVNRIIDRFKLATVDIASIKSEIEKDKVDKMLKEAKDMGVPIKSIEEQLADEILVKPIQKEERQMSNPNVAKTEKSPQSEPSLKNNKTKQGTNSKTRKSVRADLERIKTNLANKELGEKEKENAKDDKAVDNNKTIIKETKHEQVPKKKKPKERGL